MHAISATGYVIKKTRYKETSFIVELYTLEEGRISLLLKGALRENSRYLGMIEYMNLINIVFNKRETSTLYVPRSVELIEENAFIAKEPEYFMLTGELAGYVRRYLPENEADSELFTAMKYMIRGIGAGKGKKAIIYFFKIFKVCRPSYSCSCKMRM